MTDTIKPAEAPKQSWHEEAGSTYHALTAQIADGTAMAYRLNEAERELGERDDTIAELRKQVQYFMESRDGAEAARLHAEEETGRAAERADTEADRADGAESHLYRVLAAYVVEPAAGTLDAAGDCIDIDEVPFAVMDSIAENLAGELNGGLSLDDLPDSARRQLNDWAGEAL